MSNWWNDDHDGEVQITKYVIRVNPNAHPRPRHDPCPGPQPHRHDAQPHRQRRQSSPRPRHDPYPRRQPHRHDPYPCSQPHRPPHHRAGPQPQRHDSLAPPSESESQRRHFWSRSREAYLKIGFHVAYKRRGEREQRYQNFKSGLARRLDNDVHLPPSASKWFPEYNWGKQWFMNRAVYPTFTQVFSDCLRLVWEGCLEPHVAADLMKFQRTRWSYFVERHEEQFAKFPEMQLFWNAAEIRHMLMLTQVEEVMKGEPACAWLVILFCTDVPMNLAMPLVMQNSATKSSPIGTE